MATGGALEAWPAVSVADEWGAEMLSVHDCQEAQNEREGTARDAYQERMGAFVEMFYSWPEEVRKGYAEAASRLFAEQERE